MKEMKRHHLLFHLSFLCSAVSFGYSFAVSSQFQSATTDVSLKHPSGKEKGANPLDQRGGALYRQSILTSSEISAVRNEITSFMKNLHSEESSIAQNRMGTSLPTDSQTVNILSSGSLCQLVQKVMADSTMKLSSNLPVELRTYQKSGAAMAWHIDDVLYDPPQVEVVLTLENNSDCTTMWKNDERLVSVETDPNSALILRAGGPPHCVTSLKRGSRLILKCAYVSEGARFLKEMHTPQFQQVPKISRRKKKKGKNR